MRREDFITEKSENGYRITAAEKGRYSLFFSASPDGFSNDNCLGEFESETQTENPTGHRRAYFHILDENGRYSVTAARSIEADGVNNLRDLGGYNTADGSAFVRHGVFYRSGYLSRITDEGRKAVSELGLKYVLDLRTLSEAKGREDPPVPGAVMKLIPAVSFDDDEDKWSGEFDISELLSKPLEAQLAEVSDIVECYRTMLFDSAALRDLFSRLLAEEKPVLFHCAAGKDRTGVCALLILKALGVPEETIYYDYMLTADIKKARNDEYRQRYADLLQHEISRKTFDVTLSVLQSSIESSVAAVLERYGSFEEYFEKELGLGEKERQKLRELYLVKH